MIHEVLILHHTHTDIGYTHPQPVVMELHRRFIDNAIDQCERTADWPDASRLRWTCEVSATLLHWLRHAPARQIDRFRALAKADLISAGAMLYNFTPLCGPEQLARSLYPIKELRDALGLPIRTAINHDVNGLPWPITQLLLDAGVNLMIMGINIVFGGYPLTRPLAFRWEGSDGREILAFNGEHYQSFDRIAGLLDPSVDRMAEGLHSYIKKLEAQGYPHDFIYLTATHPFHTDNAPPNPDLAGLVRAWNDQGRTPHLRFITPETLLQRLDGQRQSLPVHRGDWTDYWNFGCASAAAELQISRVAKTKIFAAEKLMSRVAPPAADDDNRLLQDALWNAQAYDEHTWGVSPSVTQPDSDLARNQWVLKANYAHHAFGLGEMLLRDAQEAATHNPSVGRDVRGVQLYNYSPVARKCLVSVPKIWVDGKWYHCLAAIHRFGSDRERWIDNAAVTYGPIDVPANSCVQLALQDLPLAQPAAGCRVGEGFVESPYFRMEFDPATGRVQQLTSIAHDRQILDAQNEHSFFAFVNETVAATGADRGRPQYAGRDAIFFDDWPKLLNNQRCWKPNWPAARRGPSKLISCETFHRPEGTGLILKWEAPGVEQFTQQITLSAHRPVVECDASFRKLDIREPDGIYFVFPLALQSGWRAHFDTAGLPVELDHEQLPGSARDFVTVGQWTAIHDDSLCVTLACPDAPMVQFGDFNFGRERAHIDRSANPLLLAWPMNNYWNTNFRASQPGFAHFHYELSVREHYDPAASTLAGLDAASQVDVHPLLELSDQSTLQLVHVSDPNLIPAHVKRAEDGNGQIVRLINVTDREIETEVSLPGVKVTRAAWVDVLENRLEEASVKENRVAIRLSPRKIAQLRME